MKTRLDIRQCQMIRHQVLVISDTVNVHSDRCVGISGQPAISVGQDRSHYSKVDLCSCLILHVSYETLESN